MHKLIFALSSNQIISNFSILENMMSEESLSRCSIEELRYRAEILQQVYEQQKKEEKEGGLIENSLLLAQQRKEKDKLIKNIMNLTRGIHHSNPVKDEVAKDLFASPTSSVETLLSSGSNTSSQPNEKVKLSHKKMSNMVNPFTREGKFLSID